MKQEETIFFIKTLHKILNIPIMYCSNQQAPIYFYPVPMMKENDEKFIFKRLHSISALIQEQSVLYHLHKSFVMFGIVINHESNSFVFIGPLLAGNSNEKEISDYLFESGMSSETTKIVVSYLLSTPPLSLDKFQSLLSNINLIINGKMISSKEICAIYDQDSHEKALFAQRIYSKEQPTYEQLNTVLVEEYNRQLNYCVQTGDIDRLSLLVENLSNIPYAENNFTASLKDLKLTAFGSVFAVETEALKSGIPKADLDKTKRYYLDRIETSKSLNELHTLTISALFDFTKLVRDNLANKTNNPTINRAIDYIKTNVNSKLSAEDIAQALHVNLHYLFTKFKAETGKTLVQFINEEKIKKSCYYLTFTDKSLIDIAMHLSFSSQSYFQAVFKKVTGKTPTRWKQENNHT